MKVKILKVLALIIPPLAIFTGNFFATTDLSVGEISDTYFGDVLIIPAGYAFSIWGFIYLGILGLAIAQALPGPGKTSHLAGARIPLIANMLCNFAWIVAWQSLQIPLATVILFLQLGTAIWLYYALGIPKGEPAQTKVEAWIRVPISVYVGWLTLASVLGVSSLLSYLSWDGWGLSNPTWAMIMLVVSAAIGLIAKFAWRDAIYAAVFVWAFIAVVLRPDQLSAIAVTAAALAAIFLVIITVHLWTRQRSK